MQGDTPWYTTIYHLRKQRKHKSQCIRLQIEVPVDIDVAASVLCNTASGVGGGLPRSLHPRGVAESAAIHNPQALICGPGLTDTILLNCREEYERKA